jgi:predicted amidophosphoribosyltransferase
MKKPPLFSKAMSFGLYEETPAAAINFFKFQRIRALYRPLGDLLICFDMSS